MLACRFRIWPNWPGLASTFGVAGKERFASKRPAECTGAEAWQRLLLDSDAVQAAGTGGIRVKELGGRETGA